MSEVVNPAIQEVIDRYSKVPFPQDTLEINRLASNMRDDLRKIGLKPTEAKSIADTEIGVRAQHELPPETIDKANQVIDEIFQKRAKEIGLSRLKVAIQAAQENDDLPISLTKVIATLRDPREF